MVQKSLVAPPHYHCGFSQFRYIFSTRWQRAVSSKAVRIGGFCFVEVIMPLTFHPQPGMVLICDFSTGFKPPEMVKRRPVVVISPRPRRKTQLCIVVPLSTTPPVPVEACHHQLDPASLPGPLSTTPTWAKCDMLATVALDRLDRLKLGREANGKRLYSTQVISADDFKAIQRSVLHALGFQQLTNMLP